MVSKSKPEEHAPSLEVLDQSFAIEHADVTRALMALAAATGTGRISVFDLDKWSVPGAGGLSWTLPGGKSATTLQGVIIHHHPWRAYWDVPFGSGPSRPPCCQSFDGITGHGKPGGDCATCEFAVFGSKIGPGGKPGRGPACKSDHLCYVVTPHAKLPTVLSVPGGSRKILLDYLRGLARDHGVFPYNVLTSFGLQQARSADGIVYSQVTFTALGLLSDNTTKALAQYASDVQEQVARPLLTAGVPSGGRPEQPTTLMFEEIPDEDDEEEDDIDEPAVPETFKAR